MAHHQLTSTRIHAGYWEGVLSFPGETPPELIATLHGEALEAPQVTPLADSPGQARVRLRLPAELLGEGVHTFVISDRSGARLAQFPIIAGEPVDEDLRAELSLLRAELDMLKKAFRRHCSETS